MKTKALISFTVTVKLICVFVFAYAKHWFSHEAVGLTIAGQNDYCDTITIVKNPIAILLLLQLPIAILLR